MPGEPDKHSSRYEGLKNKQRELRSGFSEELTLRVHRGLSWYGRACNEVSDQDVRFILLWIAFNATYASFINGDSSGDKQTFKSFFRTLISLNRSRSIYQLVWYRFSKPIRGLLDNRFVFAPFWEHYNGLPGNRDWADKLERDSSIVDEAVKRLDTATILPVLFERLYVLRNQLVHGGSTWASKVNREQVCDGADILIELVPIFIDIMMDNPKHPWGKPYYPVVD